MGGLGSKCERQVKENSGGDKTKFLATNPLDRKNDFFPFPKKKQIFGFDGLTLTLTLAAFPSPFGLDLRTTDSSGLGEQDGYGVYQVSSSRF